MVGIIDDREDVWNYSPNLILVKPYHFFQHTGDIHAPPGLDKTDQDSDEEEDNLLSRVIKSALNRKTSSSRVHRNFQGSKSKSNRTKVLSKDSSASSVESSDKLDHENADSGSPGNGNDCTDEVDNTNNMSSGNSKKEDQSCQGSGSENKIGSEVSGDESSPPDIEKAVASDLTRKDNSSGKVNHEDEQASEISHNVTSLPKDSKGNENASASTENNCKRDEEVTGESLESTVNKGNNCGKIFDKSTSQTEVEADEKGNDDARSKDDSEEKNDHATKTEEAEEKTEIDSASASIPDGMVDVEDNDDYLLYLEDILNVVHTAYYKMYEQMKRVKKPDLKNVVPYVRMKVLKSVNIVFSGIIPTNMNMERNRAFIVAKSLGASIQPKLVPREIATDPSEVTTHLIAAHHGTVKVNEAKKIKGIYIVNVDWLWNCSERWEHVDERLFPLTKSRGSPVACTSSPAHVGMTATTQEHGRCETPRYDRVTGKRIGNKKPDKDVEKLSSFASSYNPLLAFSSDDIADMDKEVEEIFNEDSDESDNETANVDGKKIYEESSSGESLSGERPRGWKRRKSERWKDLVMSIDDPDEEQQNGAQSSDSEAEPPSKYQRIENLDTESDFECSIGSVDEEMAAAIEKELLDV